MCRHAGSFSAPAPFFFQAEDGIRDESVTGVQDRKSTRLNSSHTLISYAVSLMIRRPPRSTLFLHALFRSRWSPYHSIRRAHAVTPVTLSLLLPYHYMGSH